MPRPIGEVLSQVFKGKVIEEVLRDGFYARFRLNTGEEVCVEWVDDNGNPIAGYPHLRRVDVRIIVPPAGVSIKAMK